MDDQIFDVLVAVYRDELAATFRDPQEFIIVTVRGVATPAGARAYAARRARQYVNSYIGDDGPSVYTVLYVGQSGEYDHVLKAAAGPNSLRLSEAVGNLHGRLVELGDLKITI